MFVLSLLVFVLLVYDSHGETSTCDRKIESLRKDFLRLENENKIMTAQLSDFQRIKSEINKMSDDIVELRSTRKYLNCFQIFLCLVFLLNKIHLAYNFTRNLLNNKSYR